MNAKRLHTDLPEDARGTLTLSAVTAAGVRLSRGRVENWGQLRCVGSSFCGFMVEILAT